MGTNTDAILFYGFHGEEGEWGDVVDDWEERLAVLDGAVKPSAEFSDATKAAHVDFWAARQKAVIEEPCEIDTHCSGECPMPFVCVKASVSLANRGDPVEIKSLAVDPGWDASLRTFTEKMGIPWQEPKWWLVSNWEH